MFGEYTSSPTTIDIIVEGAQSGGWGPVGRLAHLASRLFGAHLIELPSVAPLSLRTRILRELPRPSRKGRHLVVIAPRPEALNLILSNVPRPWTYESISAWVIDSFWHEHIPRIVSAKGWIDRLYVMDPDDIEAWRSHTRAPVTALPWGTDALAVSLPTKERDVDVQRVGRQPPAWDDDQSIAAMAQSLGLRHAGRPPFGSSEAESQNYLHSALDSAASVLAFSNRVSPAAYTHPHRDYLTARWTDALAHGCVVVGQLPVATAAQTLIPDYAHLDISPTNYQEGLERIADVRKSWGAPLHARIHHHARTQLDWRHRLAVIAHDLELTTPKLECELAELNAPLP